MNEYDQQAGDSGFSTASDSETKQWAMVMHLSQLANLVAPPAGLIAPIVLWQIKKDTLPGVDEHGRIIANWATSVLIYTLIAAGLFFTVIGIPITILMTVVVSLLCVIYPIIGGIKASDGKAWRYPGAFRIF